MTEQTLRENAQILIVDDEQHILDTSKLALRTSGIKNVITTNDSRKVMGLLKENSIALVIIDIMMPHLPGNELLGMVKSEYPDIPVIMMTGINELQMVIECMKKGAIDYLDKPVENLRLVTSVERALDFKEVQSEVNTLKTHMLSSNLSHPDVFESIITDDDSMFSIFRYIESIAVTSRAVLVTGETGTGKELVAKAVHDLSQRKGKYVTVNVAGLDDTLFSDALFGHKKGAYTGADGNREGLLEQAQGGTIFLDEIGDLSMTSQVKLLRLLQEREYYPLGSDNKKKTDARFIVATSSNIQKKIENEEFRKDLFYRLQAHHFNIPPLRERKRDIRILIDHFSQTSAEALNKEKPFIEQEVYETLQNYAFPGNVRELESMIFNAMSSTYDDTLTLEPFKRDIDLASGQKGLAEKEFSDKSAHPGTIHFSDPYPTIDQAVDQLISLVLEKNNNNQTATAKDLGITRQGLISRLKRRQINK